MKGALFVQHGKRPLQCMVSDAPCPLCPHLGARRIGPWRRENRPHAPIVDRGFDEVILEGVCMMTDHGSDACALDDKDRIILESLEHDGRMTLAQLATAASLSVSATQSRVQKLEHKGVITGYKAILDHEKSGQPVSAYISLTPLDYTEASLIPDRLRDVDGIISCDAVSGSSSYLLMVRVASTRKLETLLNTIHAAVPVSTDTMMVLRRYFAK